MNENEWKQWFGLISFYFIWFAFQLIKHRKHVKFIIKTNIQYYLTTFVFIYMISGWESYPMAKIYSDELTSSFTSFLQCGNNRGKNPLGNDLLINSESKSTHSNNFEKLKLESEFFYHY